MISLGPHASFIVVAYLATVIVILGLTIWIVRDYAVQRRILSDLESRGIKRRSQREDQA